MTHTADRKGVTATTRDAELLDRRRARLNPSYKLFFRQPLHVARASGVWVYDADGRAYLDAYNNVVSLGHGNPEVVAAVAGQTARLNTHTRYLTDEVVDYAERLLGHFPDELDNLTVTCTGTEANELAYRMAAMSTGGRGFIVTESAYHGWTTALSALSNRSGRTGDEPVRAVPAPDSRRCADVGARFGADVRAAAADLRRHGIKPAALIVDTVFSGDGIFPDPTGFLRPAVEAIRDDGGIVVADEVQAGFARLGPHMWGFARHGITPDIVTLGKPMGNGYPLGGLVTRREIADAFSAQARYFNTFGGNPVACAAGSAVLDVIERDALCARAADVGGYLTACVRQVAERHRAVVDVRGAGLFVGLEMAAQPGDERDASALAAAVLDGMRRRGVLVGTTGPVSEVVKIRPPLVFRRTHVDRVVATLDEVLHDVTASGSTSRAET